jgi:uncharacterized protein YbgA (DUF1722 family)
MSPFPDSERDALVATAHALVRKYKEPYLEEQSYLHPHPLELQLRSHV